MVPKQLHQYNIPIHRSLLLFLLSLFCLVFSSWTLPLCSDSRAPLEVNSTLSFCLYRGKTCCSTKKDSDLKKQFQAMNISDKGCSSVVKSILCAKCDPFSSELFKDNSDQQSVPILCNSSSTTDSSTGDFCSKTWETCQNVSISGSLFAASLQGKAGTPANTNVSKLIDIWQSKTDFCNAFGGVNTNETSCFNGKPVTQNDTTSDKQSHSGLCLDKIGNGTYLSMVPHPDGSNRAFFSTQSGIVYLATIPDQDSGGVLDVNPSSPFVDLTDEVHLDTEFGMMGMAFHPKFAQNGRFFASFNCDKSKWPECTGRCSCNSDVNCDPSKLTPDSGSQPCQYHSVIAEYTTNTTSSDPSSAYNAKPTEVRRIFTLGLPFTSHHAGQILFGPSDGYLYFMMGDGGGGADPYNFSQNKKSLLGKIMRLDVDNIPSAADIAKLGLWGNYSIPKDNPFREDKDLEPEIWALGLRNPWRCSFDSSRPSYFMCADVGQDTYEEVDLITKGGNYGWRIFEGANLYHPDSSPGGNTSAKSVNTIFPVMGYNHSEVDSSGRSASITGGYFYRSETDPCTTGMYLYADLYGNGVWSGIETPVNSGEFVSKRITFSCSSDSPMKCPDSLGNSGPSLGYIFSFGEDNKKDVYLLTNNGVYRVVRPSRCNLTCSKEKSVVAKNPTGPKSSSSSSSSSLLTGFNGSLLVLLISLSLILQAL